MAGNGTITALAKYINTAMPTYMASMTKPGEFVAKPLLDMLEKRRDTDGGYQFRFPVQFGQHSQPIEYITGMEQLDFNVQDVSASGYDEIKSFAQVAVITGLELRQQGTSPGKLVSLAAQRKASVDEYMRRGVTQRLLGVATATSAPFNSVTSLNGIDYSTGILEAAAPGSQTHSVSNISKATFSFAPMMSNQYADCGGDAQSNLRNAIVAISSEVQAINGEEGMLGEGPDVAWLSSRACWNNLTRLLQAQEQYTDRDFAQTAAGQMTLRASGLKIRLSYDMPTAGTSTTANPISMYLIDSGAIYLLSRSETGSVSTEGPGLVVPTGDQFFSWNGKFREYGQGFNILYDTMATELNLLAIRRNTGRVNLSRCAIIADAEDWS